MFLCLGLTLCCIVLFFHCSLFLPCLIDGIHSLTLDLDAHVGSRLYDTLLLPLEVHYGISTPTKLLPSDLPLFSPPSYHPIYMCCSLYPQSENDRFIGLVPPPTRRGPTNNHRGQGVIGMWVESASSGYVNAIDMEPTQNPELIESLLTWASVQDGFTFLRHKPHLVTCCE